MSNIALPENENKKRNELLHERPLKIVFKTALPLLFYSFLKTAFMFFDVLTVSKIDQSMVSTVLFVTDIQNILDYVFVSTAIAVGIRISRSFGAGDFDEIKRDLSTVFFTFLFIGIAVASISIPFAKPILSFFKIPAEMLDIGSTYFSFSIFGTIFAAINTLYFSSVKARGNTKVVSICNILLLMTKPLFNLPIMHFINNGMLSRHSAVILLPLSVCLSHFLITLIALREFFAKDSPFRISWKHTSFNKEFFEPYIKLAIPIIMIKSMTTVSKVICNSQYAVYGSICLAAFSCCNRITSIVTTPLDAIQDAETTVIAASMGGHQYGRVKKTIADSLLLMIAIVTVLFIIVNLSAEALIGYFAGENLEMMDNIRRLYRIQRLDFIFMAFDSAFSAYLFAAKKTKLKTISSFLQKFVIRIPLLYVLTHYFRIGVEAIALSILISNTMTSLFTVASYFFVRGDLEAKTTVEDDPDSRLIDAVRALGRLDAFDSQTGYANGINIPEDILLIMKQRFNSDIEIEELAQEYRYALVEARIDELEKQENIYAR